MSNSGYVLLNRDIQNSYLWTDKPFSRGQAWIDMLMMANYKDNNTFIVNGNIHQIKAGSFITSQEALSLRWGWSRSKVLRFLQTLEQSPVDDYKVIVKRTPHFTTITILNYNNLQKVDSAKRTTEKQRTNTTNTSNTEVSIINNTNLQPCPEAGCEVSIKEILSYYKQAFLKKFNRPYIINWGRDMKLVKELSKALSATELYKLIDGFFASNDEFIQRTSYDVGVFKAMINKVQVETAKANQVPSLLSKWMKKD